MKLHRLEVEGFGPFLRRQSVDFESFADDGLFLISGKTGAGKSSILDAVCFALYAAIPRYDANAKRARSDHAIPDDITEVVLEFSVGDERYRITRTPEYVRPKRRGEGTTTVAPTALLEHLSDGMWVGLDARAVDVARRMDEILQLTKDQFLQVILLAQNRFSRFLLAKNDERLSLLRTLFATSRFEDYQKALDERRKASEQAISTQRAVITERLGEAERLIESHDLGDADDAVPAASVSHRLAAIEAAIARGVYRVSAKDEELRGADAERARAAEALAQSRALREKQLRREKALARLAELEALTEAIARDRAALTAARAADVVRPTLHAADRAKAQQGVAEQNHAAAVDAWFATVDGSADQPVPAVAGLREYAAGRAEQIGAWASAAAEESQLEALAKAIADAQAQAAADAQKVKHIADEAGTIAPQLADFEAEIATLATLGSLLDARNARCEELRAQLAAAQQEQRAQGEYDSAVTEHMRANAAVVAAGTRLNELFQRKIDGSAGELAARLVDGEPCMVCGATEHPVPAPQTEDHVTAEDIDTATAEREAATSAASAAAATEKAALDALAVTQRGAGGKTEAETRELLQLAADEAAASTEAIARSQEVEAAKAAALLRASTLTEKLAEAENALTISSAAIATAIERESSATQRVLAARGTAESVAARITRATAEQNAATTLAQAKDELSRATFAAGEAEEALKQALEDAGFADAAAVRDAMRDEREAAALSERVTRHDADLLATRSVLGEAESQEVPTEPVDLEGPTALAESAQQAWAQLGRELAAHESVVTELTQRAQSASTAHEQHAASLEQHETIARLADTVAGREPNTMRMSLETFILAAELEEIVAAANLRLREMSSGRYSLQHTDERAARNGASGLGIDVFDAHTSRARSAQSLSGGETFMASLALALGLAEVVTARAGGVRLDTLFIDEGFGSLDPDTLEKAMATLDELRAGGRTVGVISHVEAMKEQIPAQLHVEVAADGSSDITQP